MTKVLTEVDGVVAIVTLNRSDQRNAIDAETGSLLRAAFDAVERDDAVRVAILRGAGPVFCAGMDLKAFARGEAEAILFAEGGLGGFVKRARRKPVIASVGGSALAGGFELALACDLIVAGEAAVFGLPESRRGLVAGDGGAIRLGHRLPRAIANEIVLTGAPITAARAAALGLVNRVTQGDPDPVARELARTIAENAPLSLFSSLALVGFAETLHNQECWSRNDPALGSKRTTSPIIGRPPSGRNRMSPLRSGRAAMPFDGRGSARRKRPMRTKCCRRMKKAQEEPRRREGSGVEMRNGRGRRTGGVLPSQVLESTQERLRFVTTADGLVLRGLHVVPQAPPEPVPPVLWFHTRQQGFAEPEYVEIARRMAMAGIPFVTADTRGHDFGVWYRTEAGPVLHGSAWERFSDCVLDIDAWVDALLELGHDRCVLVGHGFAGAKVLHYQAQRQRREVAAVFLASSGTAVRDKYSDEARGLAARMVADGRGRDLMPWGTGGDGTHATVSAQWFAARAQMHREVYGDATVPPAVARVRCPIVAWYGRGERNEIRDVEGFLGWLRENAVSAASFEGHLLDDVGFYYRGHEAQIVATMLGALERLGLAGDRRARTAAQ